MRHLRLGRAGARPRRARHLVLLGALAVRHARLAATATTRGSSATTRAHVLATARDIINLWVARMLMMGLEFMGEHPVRGRRHQPDDPGARRPADVEVARDGHRPARAGRQLRRRRHPLRPPQDELDAGRALLGRDDRGGREVREQALERRPVRADRRPTRRSTPAPAGTALEDRWIRSRLAAELDGVCGQIDRYDFSAAVKELYAFVWNDFCDWYVEAVKPRLRGETRADASANLLWVLERILALTHPVCPFVTEAVWEHLPGERGLLMLAPLPAADEAHRDRDAERDMGACIEIVTAARADPSSPIEMPDGLRGRRDRGAVGAEAGGRRPAARSGGVGARAREAPRRASTGPRGCSGTSGSRARRLRRWSRPSEEKAERFAAEVTALERGWPRSSDRGRALHRLSRALRDGVRARADARPARGSRKPRAVVRRNPRGGDERQGLDRPLHRGAARGRGRPHRRLPVAAHHVVSGADPDRGRRDRPGGLRARGAARARRRRHARDAVRGADRRGLLRVRGRWRRVGGGRGGPRRAARRDERSPRSRVQVLTNVVARAHAASRDDARGDRRREAGGRPRGWPARGRRAGVGGLAPQAGRSRPSAPAGRIRIRTARWPWPPPSWPSAGRSIRRRCSACGSREGWRCAGSEPLEIWDGAHNPDGMARLVAELPALAGRPHAAGRGVLDARREGRRRDGEAALRGM